MEIRNPAMALYLTTREIESKHLDITKKEAWIIGGKFIVDASHPLYNALTHGRVYAYSFFLR